MSTTLWTARRFLRAKSAKGAAFQLAALSDLVNIIESLVGLPTEDRDYAVQTAEKTKEEMARLIYSIADVLDASGGDRLGEAIKEWSLPPRCDPLAKIECVVAQARKEAAA